MTEGDARQEVSPFGLTRRAFVGAGLAAAALRGIPGWAQDGELTARVGAAATEAVPEDYLGLSYETMQLADPDFFAPDNASLIAIFKTLSPRGILRIGGNSSEFCWWKASGNETAPRSPAHKGDSNWMPHTFTAIGPQAVDNLAGFLEAAGWRAIYGLNLGTGTPERAAREAAYVAKALGPRLQFFQIGNEPEFYKNANNGLRGPDWDFDRYLAQWLSFAHAVIAQVPGARFGGPDVGSNTEWVVRFAAEAPRRLPGRIVACTGHYYAEGPPDDPRVTVARLLGPDPRVDRDVPRMAAAARQAGIEWRMTEGNSCYRGGKPGMSNAFCAALWAADYLLKLAADGAAGVNLHGGGTKQIRASLGGHLPGEKLSAKAAMEAQEGSFYTPVAGSREHGFTARPVFYGMKLAGVVAGGRMRTVTPGVDAARATAYAADFANGGTRMVVINKDQEMPLDVAVKANGVARVWRLEAPSLTAISDVTLAGARLEAAPWKPLRVEHLAAEMGVLRIRLKPASAAAVLLETRLS
ncbi:MAG TPA: hypothetical protein VFI20_01795 [Terracidiphilus sp.]|nr:hypothetical protein [Terracidiphilus sp.]